MSSCRSKESNKNLATRLNRIEGQIRAIRNMVNDDRDCMDIMNQVLSASSALRSVWEIIAASHIEECMEEFSDKEERNQVIEKIIKHMRDLR